MPTSRLSKDRYFPWVTTKVLDVVPYPLQRHFLIQQTVRTRHAALLFSQSRMRKEAQRTKTIVHGDDDNAFCNQAGRVIGLTTRSAYECTTMDPNHNRERVAFFRPINVR